MKRLVLRDAALAVQVDADEQHALGHHPVVRARRMISPP